LHSFLNKQETQEEFNKQALNAPKATQTKITQKDIFCGFHLHPSVGYTHLHCNLRAGLTTIGQNSLQKLIPFDKAETLAKEAREAQRALETSTK